jgi:hypothetical protein
MKVNILMKWFPTSCQNSKFEIIIHYYDQDVIGEGLKFIFKNSNS